jgi:nitrate/TMAO reductase-like tetraheme cytochrome c subunit
MNALPFAFTLPETGTIVRVLGALFGVGGILLCLRLVRLKTTDLTSTGLIKLGVVTLPAVAFYKLLAFGGLIVAPAGATVLANYHVFEGTKKVEGCASCHIMDPMVNDMRDPSSDTLAARHYRNKWIAEDQCYHCHTDYGLSGTLAAKMEGYRHLSRYTTHTYPEPVRLRGTYINQNCLNCHQGTAVFVAVSSHHTVERELKNDTMNCLNCHGLAHPSPAQRTPGSPDYARLMGEEKR